MNSKDNMETKKVIDFEILEKDLQKQFISPPYNQKSWVFLDR